MCKFIIFCTGLFRLLRSKIENHFSINITMWVIQNNVVNIRLILIYITPSSRRPCAEIFKTASREPIVQSTIDSIGSAKPTIGCGNRADCQHWAWLQSTSSLENNLEGLAAVLDADLSKYKEKITRILCSWCV